jgi:hypothetical protein
MRIFSLTLKKMEVIMPGLDRTGPEGKGSRTGRGVGKCKPNSQSNESDTTSKNQPDKRGWGRGRNR